jgi:hypothetical protein
VKGLGGYHLACDATDPAAVARLRDRKHRWAKPFAVMVADLAAARRVAELTRGGGGAADLAGAADRAGGAAPGRRGGRGGAGGGAGPVPLRTERGAAAPDAVVTRIQPATPH